MYTGSLEAFSNRADWTGQFRICDSSTVDQEGIDLTGCTVELAVYDVDGCSVKLSGSTEDGRITLLEYTTGELSVIQWNFDKSLTRTFCAGSYNVGMTIANNDKTVQLFIGTVPVLHGNVP